MSETSTRAEVDARVLTFPETHGSWCVRQDGTIDVVLGCRREDQDAVVREAQWFDEQYTALKERFPRQLWQTLIDLKEVSPEHRPPREAAEIYSVLLRDEQLTKAALVHATEVQQAIVAILLPPVYLADKVHFFAHRGAALDWLSSDHPDAVRVNW